MLVPFHARTAVAAFSLGVIWLVLAGGGAVANIGVSLNVSKIDVGEGIHPGASYELPKILVSNPGSKQGNCEMTIGHMEGQQELWPAMGWFTFSPSSFSLAPDEEQEVEISLNVPNDAPLGRYAGLLKAQVMPEGTGGVAGVAAAASLTFEVVAVPVGGGLAFDALVPWIAAGALVVVLLGLARRFKIRVERRT